MARFRFHRGSLKESLKTEIEVQNVETLHDVICKEFQDYSISKSSLVIDFYGYDKRIEKNLYSVRIYGIGIVGFLDTEF